MTEAALDSNLAIRGDNTTRTFVERSSALEGVTVPVYQFAQSGVPLGRAERDRLARGITEIHHSETNAPEPFVPVVFEPMPLGTVYTAGEVSPSVLLNCGIRAGRSDVTRRRIIQRCYDLVSEVTQLPPDQIFVVVSEAPSAWIMEAGFFLPEANDEAETAWIQQLQKAYPGKYDQWGDEQRSSVAEPADHPAQWRQLADEMVDQVKREANSRAGTHRAAGRRA